MKMTIRIFEHIRNMGKRVDRRVLSSESFFQIGGIPQVQEKIIRALNSFPGINRHIQIHIFDEKEKENL